MQRVRAVTHSSKGPRSSGRNFYYRLADTYVSLVYLYAARFIEKMKQMQGVTWSGRLTAPPVVNFHLVVPVRVFNFPDRKRFVLARIWKKSETFFWKMEKDAVNPFMQRFPCITVQKNCSSCPVARRFPCTGYVSKRRPNELGNALCNVSHFSEHLLQFKFSYQQGVNRILCENKVLVGWTRYNIFCRITEKIFNTVQSSKFLYIFTIPFSQFSSNDSFSNK